MKKTTTIFLLILFYSIKIFAQQDSTIIDTSGVEKKTGFGFGGVPVVAYDTDLGFKYGVVLNIFHYGKGENYPDPNQSLYLEWSQTTKGSGLYQLLYNSRTLIKGVRTTFETSLITEKALHFYGFNGFNAEYNNFFEDDTDPLYKSRLYYRHDRSLFRVRLDFQGDLIKDKLRWLGGVTFNKMSIGKVDVNNLNKGLADSKLADTSLYEDYVNWGVINENEKNGGYLNDFKIGLIYDTRDNEANPNKGIWTELFLLTVPKFLGNEYSFSKMVFTHRQYFTLIKKRLNFDYRVSYQPKIYGIMPFYALPIIHNTDRTRDGLGGARTLRGIYRNRIVGEDYLFANLEFRLKLIDFRILKQDINLTLFPFVDGGMVTKEYKIETSNVPLQNSEELNNGEEAIHISYGSGLAIALNHNFVITATYGIANTYKDGTQSLYIGINYLF